MSLPAESGLSNRYAGKVVGATIREDRFKALAPDFPPTVEVRPMPGQVEEVMYWFDMEYYVRYLAGDYLIPVCQSCGRQGAPCAWDEDTACDPVAVRFDGGAIED